MCAHHLVNTQAAAPPTDVLTAFGLGLNPRQPLGLVVDSAGAAYMTGNVPNTLVQIRDIGVSRNSLGKGDVWVSRVTPQGNNSWATFFGGPDMEEGRAVAVDADSVFATGVFQSPNFTMGGVLYQPASTTAFDVYVARLNATNGRVIWGRTFGGESVENAVSITAAHGVVYMAGTFQSAAMQLGSTMLVNPNAATGGNSTFLVAYDYSGALVSVDAYGDMQTLWRMARDSKTGAMVFMGTDYVSRPRSSWRTSLGSSSTTDTRRGLALDMASQSVFVAAPFTGASITLGSVTLTNTGAATSFDSYVAKLHAATGEVAWARRIGSTGQDYVVNIAADGAGGVYSAGTFERALVLPEPFSVTPQGTAEIFVLRHDSSGNVIGAWAFGTTGADVLFDLALDRFGGVYLVGILRGFVKFGSNSVQQQFVARAITVRSY